MTITQLACFRSFVEEKSVTKAALRLCVTQPAVSQQIHLLAENLGCELYHRRGNKVELTSEGEFVYSKAKGILSELDELRNEMNSRGDRVVGTLRVGSGQVTAKTVLADVVQEMSQRHPGVSFSLFETYSSALPDLILRSQIDLGVGILSPGDRGLRCEKLLTGRLLLICSRKNKLCSQRVITRSKMRKLNLIRHSRINATHGLAYAWFREDHAGRGFALEAMNSETIISYVQRNMGVALASNYTIEWLKPRGISTIELEEETQIPWGIMSDASRPLPKAAKVFVEELRQRFVVQPRRLSINGVSRFILN